MKLSRLILLITVVLPGLLIAIACTILFVYDLRAYLSVPAQSQQVATAYGVPGSGAGGIMSTLFDHGLRTLLRINLFESGAGVVLGLILAAIGINGLCQLAAKRLPLGVNPEKRVRPERLQTKLASE
jgi:hypothetical protein